ncbi:ankyrin repeat-containing protein [Tanacetum coccineum]
MTNAKVAELDAEFIEYKAEAKASMDVLEKKFDDSIGKLDASIKDVNEELDVKFEELKQHILVTAPSQSTYVDPVPQTNKRVDFLELEVSNKLELGKQDDMIDDRTRDHQGARTNQAGDRFMYHGFEHRMRKLKMSVFEGEDAYEWIYKVEWRLLIRFQQLQEGNLYEQFLAITQKESARAYVALFERLACQLVGIPQTVMEATFIKGLKHALRAAVRVMNPKGLNHAMELAISIEDNQLYKGDMQSRGVVRCEEKYTPGHRCASRTLQVMLVDESDEEAEPNLNFKSLNRGFKID